MRIRQIDSAGPDAVFALSGELDLAGAPQIRSYLDASLRNAPVRVIFDCSELRFMDSSGLVLFLELHDRGVTVVLRDPTREVRSVIETTGLTAVIVMEP